MTPPFWETELDALLQSDGVDFTVVAGYVAEFGALSTVRGALGAAVAILQGGEIVFTGGFGLAFNVGHYKGLRVASTGA